jgi:hypothetical protein
LPAADERSSLDDESSSVRHGRRTEPRVNQRRFTSRSVLVGLAPHLL